MLRSQRNKVVIWVKNEESGSNIAPNDYFHLTSRTRIHKGNFLAPAEYDRTVFFYLPELVLRNQTGSLPRSNYCQPDTEMQGISEKLLNETQKICS